MGETRIPPEELPFSFDSMGDRSMRIKYGTLECPGVYTVFAKNAYEIEPLSEYYVVMPDAPAISQKARDLGTVLDGYSQIRIYAFGEAPTYSYSIIEYELIKYRIAHGELGTDHISDLRVLEALGMDDCPEYFGECPIPTETPWGAVIQHKKIRNGLYLVEAEHFGWALAICYSLCVDLGLFTCKRSKLVNCKSGAGYADGFGYRFCSVKRSCTFVYELLNDGSSDEKPWASKIHIPALKNAILKYYPKYARQNNRRWLRRAIKNGQLERGQVDKSRINRELILPDPKAGIDFYQLL